MTPPPFEDGEPAFVALEGLFEVEVRSLAGSGLTSKPHQLFAEGRQLDEDDTLPEPPPGERLVVHIASDCVTKVESDNETTSDAPESPSRRAAYPEATIKRYATTAGYSQRTWWAMIVLTVLAASAAAFLAGGTARVPISDDNLTLSAPPAATPLPAAVGGASSRAGEVEEAAASSAGAIKLNASASWDFESLLRAAYTAAGGESSPPEHAQVSEAPNWRKQALRVAKFVPLTSAALALWRPAGKRILALVLVVARTLLPAKRCEAFARFVQTNGLVPKGFEGIGQVCASARDRTGPAEAEKKKF